jgi:hypothetical protein
MTLDIRARATAQKLLVKFGKACTLNSIVAGAYDPATGLVSNVSTPYAVKLYIDSPNSEDLRGGQIVAGDSVAIFAAQGLAVNPKINDTITVDTELRVVKMVSAVWSGELVALWRVGLAS